MPNVKSGMQTKHESLQEEPPTYSKLTIKPHHYLMTRPIKINIYE